MTFNAGNLDESLLYSRDVTRTDFILELFKVENNTKTKSSLGIGQAWSHEELTDKSSERGIPISMSE